MLSPKRVRSFLRACVIFWIARKGEYNYFNHFARATRCVRCCCNYKEE